jgi:hypothetical protein
MMLKGKLLTRHPPIELAVAENTLFALPPINRIVPTAKTKMTARSPHTQHYIGPELPGIK